MDISIASGALNAIEFQLHQTYLECILKRWNPFGVTQYHNVSFLFRIDK